MYLSEVSKSVINCLIITTVNTLNENLVTLNTIIHYFKILKDRM